MWGGYAASLIKKHYDVPYMITEHLGVMALQCEFSKNQFSHWKDEYFKSAFSNTDYIVPVSEQLMRKISDFSLPNTPWRAIPNIVDTDFFALKKRSRNENLRFVCVNGFYTEKGYDILLQAFDLFCEKEQNATLTIAGENFENSEFQQILADCKNRHRITFVGELNREGVRQLLWNSDVFLLPSRVESQSISILEAMSTGLPVVCTEVVPEFMTPSFCGYRVANENAAEFAEMMLRMVADVAEFDAQEISAHTRSIAHKDVIIDAISEVYREVMDRI
jgi:glycosyltransferase involved in cell wall biosynthesis